MAEKIDAHHHLWRYSPQEYPWISDNMPQLRRDFLVQDLEGELSAAGFAGAVAVQARQTREETDWLLSLAAGSQAIAGVVGWASIAGPQFPAELERLRGESKLKGLRHIIQDEPDENFILGTEFNQGIRAMRDSGIVYDILIFQRHLPAAIRFVDRHPQQVFVLDHMAKPRIRDRILDPWRHNICELARRDNVYCKISGMVTEADWSTWTEADLRPYVDVVLGAFGPGRLMAGSDWPVCLLASTYRRWVDTLQALIGDLSVSEQDRILGGTATEVYRLRPNSVARRVGQ
jgi:L-fuconolactonase